MTYDIIDQCSICLAVAWGSPRCGSGLTATLPRLCRLEPALAETLAPYPLSLRDRRHAGAAPSVAPRATSRCSPRRACCRRAVGPVRADWQPEHVAPTRRHLPVAGWLAAAGGEPRSRRGPRAAAEHAPSLPVSPSRACQSRCHWR